MICLPVYGYASKSITQNRSKLSSYRGRIARDIVSCIRKEKQQK